MKRIVCVLLVFVLFCSLFSAVAAPVAPALQAPSAILMEKETGRVLFEKDADTVLPPASVTKIMTLLLVMEAIDGGQLALEDTVTISPTAQGMGGSQVYLEAGETYTVHELLKAVVIASGNDASVALAEHLSGSEETFVGRMNERAAELGMTNTFFRDCTGLYDEGHYTTARDIALMSQALMMHPKIRDYTTIWMDSLRDGTFGLSNTNRLIRSYQGATGLKTGFTRKAKYCMSATAERGGMELIAVIMADDTSDLRNKEAATLLDFGFANYKLISAYPDEILMPVPVLMGTQTEVQPELLEGKKLVVEKNRPDELIKEVTISPDVEAPVVKGQKLGTLIVRSGDEVLQELTIVASEDVPRLTFWQILGKLLRGVLMA